MKKIFNVILCVILVAVSMTSIAYGDNEANAEYAKPSDQYLTGEENGELFYTVNDGTELKDFIESAPSSGQTIHVLLNNTEFHVETIYIREPNHFVFECYYACSIISDNDAEEIFYINKNASGSVLDFSRGNITFTSLNNDYSSDGSGGVIDVDGNDVTIIGGYFKNCSAMRGGAIYSGAGLIGGIAKNLTIRDAFFYQCSAHSGGAISSQATNTVIDNCEFWYCMLYPDNGSIGNGGAVILSGDDSQIINSSFHYNKTQEDADGGAVCIAGYNSYVGNSFFEYNYAAGDGGAIDINDDAVIENCKFQYNNAGGNGGAIYDENSAGDVYIRNCAFRGGNCGGNGVWVDCTGDAHIEGCTDLKSDDYYHDPASYTNPDLYPYDDFEGYEIEIPYSQPNMNEYARQAIIQNEYCDVIRPYLSNTNESELAYFMASGTTDNGMGWKIDYENPLTITALDNYLIQRVEFVITSGNENYESLLVNNGTRQDSFNNPCYFGDSLAKEYIAQIDDINSDSVTLTVNGSLYNYGTMHITDIVVYFEDPSAQDVLSSTLSGGSLAIITAVAGLAVGMIGMFFIMKNKNKNAENSVNDKQ